MIDSRKSLASGREGRLVAWPKASSRSEADGSGESLLRETLAAAIDQFCATDLQVTSVRQAISTAGETVSVDCIVSGFAEPLTCRMKETDLIALCNTAMGATDLRVEESPGLNGPIGRHVSMQLMRTLIERFCRVASTISGEKFEPSCERGMAENGVQPRMRRSELQPMVIDVHSHGLCFEFLLSKVDYVRLASGKALDPASDAGMRGDATGGLETGMAELEVLLSVVLDGQDVTAGELRSWKIGTVVQMMAKPRPLARLTANGTVLHNCEIARDAEFFAIRVVGEGDAKSEIR